MEGTTAKTPLLEYFKEYTLRVFLKGTLKEEKLNQDIHLEKKKPNSDAKFFAKTCSESSF